VLRVDVNAAATNLCIGRQCNSACFDVLAHYSTRRYMGDYATLEAAGACVSRALTAAQLSAVQIKYS
jgi:hypothetical protein